MLLPVEVMYQIMTHASDQKTLCRMEATCTALYAASARYESAWKQCLARFIQFTTETLRIHPANAKQGYRRLYLFLKCPNLCAVCMCTSQQVSPIHVWQLNVCHCILYQLVAPFEAYTHYLLSPQDLDQLIVIVPKVTL